MKNTKQRKDIPTQVLNRFPKLSARLSTIEYKLFIAIFLSFSILVLISHIVNTLYLSATQGLAFNIPVQVSIKVTVVTSVFYAIFYLLLLHGIKKGGKKSLKVFKFFMWIGVVAFPLIKLQKEFYSSTSESYKNLYSQPFTLYEAIGWLLYFLQSTFALLYMKQHEKKLMKVK